MKFCYEYGTPSGWKPVVYHGEIDTVYRKVTRTIPVDIPETCIDPNGEPNFGRLTATFPPPKDPPAE